MKTNSSIKNQIKAERTFNTEKILCQNKVRMLLSEEDDILRRWAERFDELLNKEFFNQNATRQETYQAYSDINEPTPTLDDVRVENAIQKLKDNETPGIHLTQAELIKKAGPDFVERMYQLIIKICITEIIPED
jgi:hypothetical protein